MENEVKFASGKYPILVFLTMLIFCHNFYIRKPAKAILLWILFGISFFVLKISPNENVFEGDSRILQATFILAIGIIGYGLFSDLDRLWKGTLTDGNGKLVTYLNGCPNCGFLGEMNSSSDLIDSKKIKVKVEKIIAKNYDRFGRYTGSTKEISEVDGWHRTTKTTTVCPNCEYFTEEIKKTDGK